MLCKSSSALITPCFTSGRPAVEKVHEQFTRSKLESDLLLRKTSVSMIYSLVKLK